MFKLGPCSLLIMLLLWFQPPLLATDIHIEAEDGTWGSGAFLDQRGHDSGGWSVYIYSGGYSQITAAVPQADSYYVFVRVRSGYDGDPYYGVSTYTTIVNSAVRSTSPVDGTLEYYGDGDNWIWLRTDSAIYLDGSATVKVTSSWTYAMVDWYVLSPEEWWGPPPPPESIPETKAVRTAVGPVLDGLLTDACWDDAQRITEFNNRDNDGRPTNRTEAMLVWTNTDLYVAMRFYQPNVLAIDTDFSQFDDIVYHDDSVELFLDTNHNGVSCYHLAANIDGVRFDEHNWDGADSWNGSWQVATQRFADCWQIEFRIPLAQFGSPSIGTTWGLNLYRTINGAVREHISWSDLIGGRIFMCEPFGHLQFSDAGPTPYLEIDPFLLSSHDNAVSGTAFNPTGSSLPATVLVQVVDPCGLALELTDEITIPALSSSSFNIPFTVRASGEHEIIVSLLNQASAVLYRAVLTDDLPLHEFVTFGTVSQQPYYSTEDQAKINVYVNMPLANLPDYSVKAILKQGISVIDQHQTSLPPGDFADTFDIDLLANGDYTIEMQLLDNLSQVVEQNNHNITVLPEPTQTSVVEIDQDGVTLINGQKRFLVTATFGGASADLASIGVDSISNISSGLLDAAAARGMMVMALSESYFRGGADYEGFRETVSQYKDHPALLGWYIADEPSGGDAPPGRLARAQAIAHLIDPCHIVVVLDDGTGSMWRPYASVGDVFASDPYPIDTRPISLVSDWTDGTIAAMGNKGGVWMTMQTHDTPGRTPTQQEFGNMNYQAIIHGALGLNWWCYSYNAGNGGMVASGYWDYYGVLTSQIRTLEPVLVNGQKGQLEVRANGVHSLTKTHEGITYIFAANVNSLATPCSFNLEGTLPTRAEVMFEDRTIPITADQFDDQFDAYDVHVYRIDPDYQRQCGDEGTYIHGDLNNDCYINIQDVCIIASQWLWCSDPSDSSCDQYWDNSGILFTEDFDDYSDGTLLENADNWALAHLSEPGHKLQSGYGLSADGEIPGISQDYGNAFVAAEPPLDTPYERVALDFQWSSSPVASLRIGLNYDSSTAYAWPLYANQYALNISLDYGYYLAKRDSVGTNQYNSGWQSFSSPLILGSWYRTTLEKDGTTITGTITSLDGSTTYGQISFNDDGSYGSPRHGGYPIVCSGLFNDTRRSPHIDHFEYEFGWPPGQGPQYCGDSGTVYLDTDLLPDCRIDLSDISVIAENWLFCTEPSDENCASGLP